VLLALATEAVDGVAFESATFTPRSATHAGRACRGIRIRITDHALRRASRTGLAIVRAVIAVHADRIALDRVLPLVGSRRVLDALVAGEPLDRIAALAEEDAAAFEARRAPFLLYP
jgi:uncharacterized protein YbbC (DUF1343 family)